MLNEIEAAQIQKSRAFIAHLQATLDKETEVFNERCAFLKENISQHQVLLIALANASAEVE